jgi:Domain of unknown function (DUF6766)
MERRSWVRDNGLSLFFLGIFLATLLAQSIAGHNLFNEEQTAHHEPTISYWHYLTTSSFGQAVTENWQSEFLQFVLFILATTWLIQRGSPESKEPGKAGRESDEEQQLGPYSDDHSPAWARLTGGARRWIYSNSLVLLFGLFFLWSWFAQSVTGWSEFNAEQLTHKQPTVDWLGYLASSQFWQDTLQNWQSEFLAVGSMAIYAVYLRQRGSPESKPVGAPHDATGVEG